MKNYKIEYKIVGGDWEVWKSYTDLPKGYSEGVFSSLVSAYHYIFPRFNAHIRLMRGEKQVNFYAGY